MMALFPAYYIEMPSYRHLGASEQHAQTVDLEQLGAAYCRISRALGLEGSKC